MMDKQEIYAYLKSNGIWHEITEHKAVYNMAELSQTDIPYPEAGAINLFVRDDKCDCGIPVKAHNTFRSWK